MSGCKRGLTPTNCVRFQKMNDLTQKVAIPITLGHALAIWQVLDDYFANLNDNPNLTDNDKSYLGIDRFA